MFHFRLDVNVWQMFPNPAKQRRQITGESHLLSIMLPFLGHTPSSLQRTPSENSSNKYYDSTSVTD